MSEFFVSQIAAVLREHQQSPYSPYDDDGCGEHSGYDTWPEHAAEAVAAAVRPVVLTAEDLDALPRLTVILVGGGLAVQRDDDGWYAAGGSYAIDSFTDDAFPALVLWTPEETPE